MLSGQGDVNARVASRPHPSHRRRSEPEAGAQRVAAPVVEDVEHLLLEPAVRAQVSSVRFNASKYTLKFLRELVARAEVDLQARASRRSARRRTAELFCVLAELIRYSSRQLSGDDAPRSRACRRSRRSSPSPRGPSPRSRSGDRTVLGSYGLFVSDDRGVGLNAEARSPNMC